MESLHPKVRISTHLDSANIAICRVFDIRDTSEFGEENPKRAQILLSMFQSGVYPLTASKSQSQAYVALDKL